MKNTQDQPTTKKNTGGGEKTHKTYKNSQNKTYNIE